MQTQLTIFVNVRPHGEAVQIDGITFTSPTDLWQYLHGAASRQVHKPKGLQRSTFITTAQMEELVRKMPTQARELLADKAEQDAEVMGL